MLHDDLKCWLKRLNRLINVKTLLIVLKRAIAAMGMNHHSTQIAINDILSQNHPAQIENLTHQIDSISEETAEGKRKREERRKKENDERHQTFALEGNEIKSKCLKSVKIKEQWQKRVFSGMACKSKKRKDRTEMTRLADNDEHIEEENEMMQKAAECFNQNFSQVESTIWFKEPLQTRAEERDFEKMLNFFKQNKREEFREMGAQLNSMNKIHSEEWQTTEQEAVEAIMKCNTRKMTSPSGLHCKALMTSPEAICVLTKILNRTIEKGRLIQSWLHQCGKMLKKKDGQLRLIATAEADAQIFYGIRFKSCLSD